METDNPEQLQKYQFKGPWHAHQAELVGMIMEVNAKWSAGLVESECNGKNLSQEMIEY